MRDHRIVFLVVLIVAAALLTGYLIGRAPALDGPAMATEKPKSTPSRDSAPTREKKTPSTVVSAKPNKTSDASAPTLSDVYADLKRRADANDADAASELYGDLHRCSRQQELSRTLPNWLRSELDGDISSGYTEDQLKMHEQFLGAIQKELEFMQRNAAFCNDTPPDMLKQLVPVSLKAAQLGDLKALRCYIGGEISESPGVLDHPEWLSDFKQNGVALADYGFKHGDWGVVGLYGHSYGGVFSSSLLGQLLGTDPVQAYQYLKLQQIGATGAFLKKITGQTNAAAADLTPEQIAQADGWAQDMYTRYFNGSSSNELSNGVNTCGGFDE